MMNQVQKLLMFIGIFTINLSFAQGFKVETDKGLNILTIRWFVMDAIGLKPMVSK